MKEHLFQAVEAQRTTLTAMADSIFDDPELGFQEFHAQKKLTDYLTQSGFQVETGTGGVETAFRAEFRNGQGGPRIGLLCEYDALEGLGHACGHHMQGPAIVGAAKALKDCAGDRPFSVVVYGTPAEETAHGKLRMLEKGCFQDIDVALMMHGSPTTTVDVKSMAMSKFTVTFHGKKSHAALKPEAGRSALDALLLAFQAVEFLREHVPEDTRMHYTIKETPGPTNVVPARAVGEFSLRSYSREVLNDVCRRFEQIIQGAALMADVEYEITKEKSLDNKVPCYPLNEIIMDNAAACGAPGLAPVRKKTGSTDFGNVTNHMPGCCIRVKFVPTGTSSHTQAFVDAGKSQEAHDAILYGAKTLAGTACDLICQPERVKELWDAFEQAKANA
mgnify:CR=1 FL=1